MPPPTTNRLELKAATPGPYCTGASTPAATKSTSRGLVIGIGLILLAAHVPLLFAHFRGLWLKPHYQLVPIVLVGAFLLLWPTASMAPAKAGVLFPAIALLGVGAGLFIVVVASLFLAASWPQDDPDLAPPQHPLLNRK